MAKILENKYETMYWANNQYVMGIDEAGRGPVAGPEVVACCVLPINYHNERIFDSKQINKKLREELFKEIIKDAHHYAFVIVSPKEIDETNIYATTKKAMFTLSNSTNIHSLTITDAMPLEKDNVVSLIKGDAKSISVAAASILAKVLRDHIMLGYDVLYPQYEYRNHKGYLTSRHLELMQEYGLNDLYRRSYSPCSNFQLSLFEKN